MTPQEGRRRYFPSNESNRVHDRLLSLARSEDIHFLQGISVEVGGFDEIVDQSRREKIGKLISPMEYSKDFGYVMKDEPVGVAYPLDEFWKEQYLCFRNGVKMIVERVERNIGISNQMPSDEWKGVDDAVVAFDRKQRSYGINIKHTNYKNRNKKDLEILDELWGVALEKAREDRDKKFSGEVVEFLEEREECNIIYRKKFIPQQ